MTRTASSSPSRPLLLPSRLTARRFSHALLLFSLVSFLLVPFAGVRPARAEQLLFPDASEKNQSASQRTPMPSTSSSQVKPTGSGTATTAISLGIAGAAAGLGSAMSSKPLADAMYRAAEAPSDPNGHGHGHGHGE